MKHLNCGDIGQVVNILMDCAPCGCILLDDGLKVVDCNERAVSLVDAQSKQALVGLWILDFLPERQPDGQTSIRYVKEKTNLVLKEGSAQFFLDVFSIEGSLKSLEIYAAQTVIFEKHFFVVHLSSIRKDCQDCTNLEENRLLSRKMQDLFDHMPVMCAIYDKDMNVVDCNLKAVEIFGMRDKQELLNRYYELIPEFQPDGTPSMEKVDALMAGAHSENISQFEWWDQKPNGEMIPSLINTVRFAWKDGLHVAMFSFDLRDAHRRIEAERAVLERMKTILNASPTASLVIAEDLRIVEHNKALADILGEADKNTNIEEYVVGRSPEYQPDGRLSVEKLREKYRHTLEVGRANFEWIHKNAANELLPCEITMIRINDMKEQVFVLVYIKDLRTIREAALMMERMEQLELMANTDPLTGVYNRRCFVELAESELKKCVEGNLPFSVIMADIDHFKAVNDTFGHTVGDEVLKTLIARMRKVLRKGETIVRYGGEEFIIMLPGIDAKKANEVAWRINAAIKASKFQIQGDDKLKITVSLGIGSRDGGTQPLSALIDQADKSLYAAKAAGRDTVIYLPDR